MTVSASLAESAVTVEPGAAADVTVQVLNSGDTVEEVTFAVLGPCAAWAEVEPGSLSLYPGASGRATVRLRPPRGWETPAGELPLGVRAVPTSDRSEPVVSEGTVTVLPFTEVTAELVPRGSHSAWRGRHQVAVDSRGNEPATVRLTAQEGTERARLTFEPAELRVPPGQAEYARLRVRPVQRVWRGAPVTHPFQAVVAPQAGEGRQAPEPVVLDGTYEQQAILPRWLPRALVAAVLAVALLAGLWYALLRPTVESAAREAITPDAIEEAQREHAAGGDGGDAGAADGATDGAGPDGAGGADGAGPDPDGGGDGGPDGTGDTSGPGGGAAGGGAATPTSARAEVRGAVGGGPTTATVYEVPAGSRFELTDIVVQNPQGDAGSLTIASQGDALLSLALENFRDSDYHFVTPVAVPAGGEITVSLDCREVGEPIGAPAPAECAESVFLSGMLAESGD